MDVRLLLRVLAIVALVIAVPLGLRALRRWPARRASGIVAGGLAVLALGGFILSALDVRAPRAPLPDSLSTYYVEGEQGVTVVAGSAATGALRWRYRPPASAVLFPNELPPFDNGAFYLRTDGAIRAVRASDGADIWAAPVQGRAFQQMPPTADHGVVYATSAASVVALRATDGSQLWQTSGNATQGSATFPPLAANGRVYVAFSSAGPQTTISALDAGDGAVRWTHTVVGADFASLMEADGIVYAAYATQKTTVVALNAGDGAVRWTSIVDNDVKALAVTDGVLVLSSVQVGLVALDAKSGSRLWQHSDPITRHLPIIANGVVYMSGIMLDGNRGAVLAVDARTGKERWRTVLDQDADVYVSLAGQMLYVGGMYAYGLRASDGHVVWRYGAPAQYYQPVAYGGVVFVGSTTVGRNIQLFGIGSNDFLSALDARTGALYWRTSGDVECMPMVSS